MGEKSLKDLLSVIWVVRSGQMLASDLYALDYMLDGRSVELIIVDDLEGEELSISDASDSIKVLHHDHARGPAASFAEGARAAHGGSILYIESPFILQPSGLASLERDLRRDPRASWGLCRRACRTIACA